MLSQRLGTIAFGSVVAGGVEMNAVFPRSVYRWLGDFAGDEGIHAQCDGLVDITLRRTRTPGNTLNRTVMTGNKQRLTLQPRA